MSTATTETVASDLAVPDVRVGAPDGRADTSSQAPSDASHVYRGRTIDELIPRIQAELGRDAIVIRRQSGLTGGFAGFFQRPYVEIEARRGSPGVDRYDEDDATPAMPGDIDESVLADLLARSQPPRALSNGHRVATAPAEDAGAFHELTTADLRGAPAAPEAGPPGKIVRGTTDLGETATEPIASGPFAAVLAEAEASAGIPGEARASTPEPDGVSSKSGDAYSKNGGATAENGAVSRSRARDAIARRLLEVGVGEELVRELLEAAAAHVMPFMPARTSLLGAVQTALTERIPAPRALPAGNATIVVVGPGGSGKTSCCAALLAAYRKRSALPAACATILEGTQRGSLEMLLSPHVQQPVPVGDQRALTALRQAREEGVVLLDTPAVSPVDRSAIRALAALLAELRADRVVLALPATLGAKPAAQLLRALRPLNADTIAITHADETDQLGVATDAACAFGLAPGYVLERARGAGLARVEPSELAERLLATQ